MNPQLTEVRNNLQMIAKIKQLEQTETQYTQILAQNGDDPAIHNHLGTINFQMGRHQIAIDYWREAIRLRPDWPEPLVSLAGLLLTSNTPALRNPAEALQLTRRAAELTHNANAGILEKLSMALAVNGKYLEAIKTAELAIPLAQKAGDKMLAESLRQHVIDFKTKRDENS
ncbi:MAG: tetratricopeptide repeat protein [Planctomycetes bacterium]|nr:tetratricopeptide repeat protein [Planctomycetota bacterium]